MRAHVSKFALLVAWMVAGSLSMPAVAEAQGGDRWVDAGVTTQGATYLFQGSTYLRFHNAQLDPGYPRALAGGGWQGLPTDFQAGLDAALYAADRDKTYFFKGNQYLRLTGVVVDPGYPRALPGGWHGLPAEFQSGIDAALFSGGHVFFFKAGRYVRFTGNQIDPGYPADLPGGWELPPDLRQIDAAVSVGDKNFFFSGASYVRLTGTRADPGYPLPLPGGWSGLPAPGQAGSVPQVSGGTSGTPPSAQGSGQPTGEKACWNPSSANQLAVGLLRQTEASVTEDGVEQAGWPIEGVDVVVEGANGLKMTGTTDQSGTAYFVLPQSGPYVVSTGPGVDSAASRVVEVLPNCRNLEMFFFKVPPEPDTCAAAEKEAAETCWTQDLYDALSSCYIAYTNMMAGCLEYADRNTGDDGGAFEKCKEQTTGLYNNCGQEVHTEVGNCARPILRRAGCSSE